jgi:hypothetical protein
MAGVIVEAWPTRAILAIEVAQEVAQEVVVEEEHLLPPKVEDIVEGKESVKAKTK